MGTHSTVDSVRQLHHNARLLDPLALSVGYERVEHRLRRVREVSVLRLPQRQQVRAGVRVTHFEAEDT